ncbi:hypothetical protein A2899_04830 [Candidatus Amesbacteria bacterium RIFCSPLOWO2_01_FULL_49_25]|uniref:Uncharacterized protein n=1 Tax=Candidatus Amesbacteria bacterium RIFCSPHIGHO2_01_FULL_48_32b TaxID=1797253 RepID=A0A1F4YFR0_9BACT|nr:MAG: hypothetical protein A2876_01810 [Candidatus Amesbacteria bacterium RIFCSPHIGHO2_01_FULL_48_32b]OGD07299.1 MAG: hypothetical protein A2899_04830 [Candidatus Amesbacteria bacterium RIFCSPLOWO2_01_FULL_49_25]
MIAWREMASRFWHADSLARFKQGYEVVTVTHNDGLRPKRGRYFRWDVEPNGYNKYLADFVNKMAILAGEVTVGAVALGHVLK